MVVVIKMPHIRFEKYWYCDYCEFHAHIEEAVKNHEKSCPKKP